ncbi:MAG: N-6 DNA methylase [Saprospiraceae bacterium]|nr:N-6 DNA methylase [Candidatus Defluviibacterium haderslevense]
MGFFQDTVVNKYLKTNDSNFINQAYIRYKEHFHNLRIQENIRNSKEEQYQGEFLIDLFVKVLGYTKNPTDNFNLTTEYKNVKDSKKADGAILINGIVKAVIELKGTNTTDLGKIEEQAFGYKNNQPECIYVITSNFEKLRLYIDNAIEHIEFNLFTLNFKDFELLYLCLAYENLEKNIPKKIKDESLSEEDVITKKLYKDYSIFKSELFHNIVSLNPDIDSIDLFQKSQKLIDRFLFLFFAEDRSLLPPNSVRLILSDWRDLQDRDEDIGLYDRFKKYFEYLNTGYKGKRYEVFAYNGGLFKLDDILDVLKIDDELLYKHTLKLSEYNFNSEVDVNILGHIFENSLNELDELKAQSEGEAIDRKKTRRKKDGVFYTPKYITKYIVDNTVGKLCIEKKQEIDIRDEDYIYDKKRPKKTTLSSIDKLNQYKAWLLQLTICDPACGSGAFLNQALDFLIKEHKYIDELQAKLLGEALVFSDIEKSILENNLYGVDINEESVEIAKLSLWLRTAQPNRKLNDLNNNIKCGNSLIDDPDVAGDKAFNWHNEFPEIFSKGGFDVVIGNPPYVDIKALDKKISNELFKKYQTAENRINLYSIFLEKGFQILKDYGILSYINPNSILVNSSYTLIRKLLIDDMTRIVKLPDAVFEDATVETIIFEFRKKSNQNNLETIIYNKEEKINSIDIQRTRNINKEKWKQNSDYNYNIYLSKEQLDILIKLQQDSINLGEISDFTLGITPYDKYRGHSSETITNRSFHSKTKISDKYKPLITGENITRYNVSNKIKEYIHYGDWLGASREERFFTTERILVRQIVSGNPPRIYAGLTNESLYFTQIGFGIIPKTINIKYILGLLNSKLINFYHKYRFLDLEKELFQKILIANCKSIPIKKSPNNQENNIISKVTEIIKLNQEIHKLINKITTRIKTDYNLQELSTKLENCYKLSVNEYFTEIMKLKVQLKPFEKDDMQDYFENNKKNIEDLLKQIEKTDSEIDQMVYKLYELTEEEIRIVEES